MKSILVVPLLAGLWSCSAFSPAPPTIVAHRFIYASTILFAADDLTEPEQTVTQQQVSRRSAMGRAAAAAALTAGVASPDDAQAYGASLDEQVRAIENANYMVSGPDRCISWSVCSLHLSLIHVFNHPSNIVTMHQTGQL